MKIAIIFYRILLVLIFLTGIPAITYSQAGYPFISNFSFNETIDNDNFDLLQDDDNNILFANRKGILTFNSRSWDFLPLAYYPLCLEKSPFDGSIYAGCQNGYGILKMDETGKYTYTSLNNIDSTGEISSISVTSENIFFINQYRIFQTTSKDFRINKLWEFAFEHPVTGSFVFKDAFYFNILTKGLYKAVNDTFELVTANSFTENMQIVFAVNPDSATVIIGTSTNRLFLFDGRNFLPVSLADYKYLDESMITDGAYLGNNKVAIGSLLGGVLICDYKTGKTDNIINYNTGLPDDEIFCLATDNYKGLWLCHSYGVSRIDTWLPLKNFTWFPGLTGNLTNSAYFNRKLYVGTSEGIYALEEKRDYSEKVVYEKVRAPAPSKPAVVNTPVVVPEKAQPVENVSQPTKRSLRILRRLQSKTEKAEQQISKSPPAEEQKKPGILKSIFSKAEIQDNSIRKKKIYSLQSISHYYSAVPGIKGKCTELIEVKGHLLAGMNSGLYEIKDNRSVPILPNKYIQFISTGLDNSIVFAGAGESLFVFALQNGNWEVVRELDALGFTVYSACMTDPNTLWLGSDNAAYKLKVDKDFFIGDLSRVNINTPFSDKVNLKLIHQKLYFFLSSGIFKMENDSIINIKSFDDLYTLPSYYLSNDQVAIYHSGEKWGVVDENANLSAEYLNIFTSVQDVALTGDGDMWIIANNKQIFKASKEKYVSDNEKFNVHFSSLKGKENEIFPLVKPNIEYRKSSLKINFSAPFYITPGKTEFRYYIKGLNPEWSEWSSAANIEYPLLPPGNYSIHIQARNIFGSESEESVMDFRIKPPFYKTKLFYAFIIIMVLALFSLFVRIRERNLIHAKQVLEKKVKERTAEIERQKNVLAEQKKEITDSIHYAKRIQSAVLPSISILKTFISDHFVLFLPRDIVSGDFYWSMVRDDKVVITAVDCTGHGVPGAFMSMLGVSFLNEIVPRLPLDSAAAILDALRTSVKSTLAQSGTSEQRDGMDIALCIIDRKEMKMQYAGAYNPLLMIRNKELTEVKADKMPIGTFDKTDNFTNHEIKLNKGDTFYLFSDGYIDQFGGPTEKKFLAKPFKEMLLKIHEQTFDEQRELLKTVFENWKGKLLQIDDVLVIGFRI